VVEIGVRQTEGGQAGLDLADDVDALIIEAEQSDHNDAECHCHKRPRHAGQVLAAHQHDGQRDHPHHQGRQVSLAETADERP
jgi:hypothetical protein